ncbi:DUF4304 domain-containing protein [Riemerella anatipestifer]|uniref:DUF4304 domain-containing protein n=1 Tax=Riemerella anatipestifer TaxID=34085 RepID=UPI001AD7411D|nr:DUF4304 domain-containing protein [Riemerella anatipestifer]MBO4232715.1 DUF4304 domain-containing protein [Riemerella anatipestifer]
MESKDFKKVFGNIAKENYFTSSIGIWYKDSDRIIVTLSLQKSNYGDYFYLNIKIFIKGIFGIEYKIDKSLKNDTGDIFLRSPKEYDEYFNFENNLIDDERINGVIKIFNDFINPFTQRALKIEGIKALAEEQKIILLPDVQLELEKMIK